MLTLDLEEFAFELSDGAVKHVGASNTAATGKLYEVSEAEARAYGDKRVKLAFADEDGNEIEVALGPEQARAVAEDVASMVEDSPVFD